MADMKLYEFDVDEQMMPSTLSLINLTLMLEGFGLEVVKYEREGPSGHAVYRVQGETPKMETFWGEFNRNLPEECEAPLVSELEIALG